MDDKAEKTDLIVFRPQGAGVSVEVKLQDETVWLTQAQMVILFPTERSVITKHLHNIFHANELKQESNVQKNAHCSFG